MIKFAEAERIYKRGYQYKRREPDHIFLRCDGYYPISGISLLKMDIIRIPIKDVVVQSVCGRSWGSFIAVSEVTRFFFGFS